MTLNDIIEGVTRNPAVNALAALVYISLVASVMFYGFEHDGPGKSLIIPIAVLSLFTLSAAVMGFIFGSQPLQLYLDGKKKEGVKLFLQTVVLFAGITSVILILFFSGIIKD